MNSLPAWVTVVVVLTVLGLLGYSIIVLGTEGAPLSFMLGGLLTAYTGVNELIKRKNNNGEDR